MNLPDRVARALSSKVPQVFCNQIPDGWYEVGHMDRDGPISDSTRHVVGKYRDYTEALTQMTAHQFQLSARIAIATMREPTEAMCEAAGDNDALHKYDPKYTGSSAWCVMIDAALAES